MILTTGQWIEKQRAILAKLKAENKPLEIAARTAMAEQANRIFIQGKKTDGSNIGQYDTKTPFYVNPNTSAGFTTKSSKYKIEGLKPPKGKHGDTHFKNGKPHKTTFVNNYKDFRNRVGRRIDKIDATLSGDLQSDFRNAPVDSVAVNPKKVSVNEYQIVLQRDKNVEKLQGLESRKGEISDASKAERNTFVKVANFELKKMFA